MIIVFTGNGKGKTTAALGVALRASGWGKRIAVIQFIKGHKEIGEWKAIQKLDDIDIFQFLDDNKISIGEPTEQHKITIPKALKKLKDISESGKYQLIILDEVNNALDYKLLKLKDILPTISNHQEIDFILTGRNASKELIGLADLVTEMKEIKHPFQKKIPAKKGIDY